MYYKLKNFIKFMNINKIFFLNTFKIKKKTKFLSTKIS